MSENSNSVSTSSRVYVLFYSFFLIPLMVAVIGTSFFIVVKFLTLEPKTPSDLLNDIRIGSATKRWQSAFELSKILANDENVHKDNLFRNQLVSAYKNSVHDDEKVRMYLAMAMGRSGDLFYGNPLVKGLLDKNPATRLASIKALGFLKYKPAVSELVTIIQNKNRTNIEHLSAVVSLGNIGDDGIIHELLPFLDHEEVNIRWDTALSLAKLGDKTGITIIADLLTRSYYESFPEVDYEEANQAISVAIQVSSKYKEEIFKNKLIQLASEDENMKIRDSAIKTLKYIYGYNKA